MPTSHGLRLIIAGRGDPELKAKFEAALQLIADRDPHRLQQMQRDIMLLYVCPLLGVNGLWRSRTKVCEIDIGFGRRSTPSRLALLLVHEAEHARQHAEGLKYTRETRLERERSCVEAELKFASHLPDGGSLVSSAARRLNTVHQRFDKEPPPQWSKWAAFRWLDRVLGGPNQAIDKRRL